MSFQKIIKLCESRGFLQTITQTKAKVETFKIGPMGLLLQHNLYTEWFNGIVTNKDIQVFPFSDNIKTSFDFAKDTCLGIMPFGLAGIKTKKQMLQEQLKKQTKDGIDFSSFFDNDFVLECCIFLNPKSAREFFLKWQRERRMWWRKFSASPGRYNLTDIETTQQVDIVAKYEFGDQYIENIALLDSIDNLTVDQLKIKEGRKTVQAKCVVSKISLSTMLLNTLCDVYDEPVFQDTKRELFRFHRKLAPYKISFGISPESKNVEELKDLSLFLCRKLRKNNVSCLLISHQDTIDWKQYDEMGIPYNLIINEATLTTGIAFLRSRDTTLQEPIHVTDLPEYVEKIFRNY